MPPIAETADDTEVERDDTAPTASPVDDVDDVSDATEGAAAATEVEEAPATPDYGAVLSEFGFDGKSDPKEFLSGLHSKAQRAQQLEPYLPHVQQYQRDYADLQAWRAEKAKQAEAAKQQQKAKWEAPKWDPTWAGLVKGVDPRTGKAVPHEEYATHQAEIDAYNARKEFERNTFAMLTERPIEYAQKTGLEDHFREIASQIYQQQSAEREQQQAIQRIEQERSALLLEQDASGQPIPGQLSREGELYVQFFNEFRASGITDPKMLDRLAYNELKALAWESTLNQPAAQAPAEPAQTAEQIRDTKNGQFLKRTNKAPGRGGAANGKSETRTAAHVGFKARALELGADVDDWGKVPE